MRILFLVSLMPFLFSCKSKPEKEVAASPPTGWSGQMQGMAGDVKTLLPYLYDSRAFNDPKNRDTINKALRDFSKSAHQIDPSSGKNFIGDSLLLEYSISSLQEELSRAAQSFEAGQLDYSRSVAKTSLSTCFRCHSLTREGASAPWDLDHIHNLTLAPLEKADLLVAARKYEKALTYMESQLNSPEFYTSFGVDFEALLRRYLALLIRVEKDPQRALNALNKVLDRGDTPQYVLEQADGWRKSLELWRREKTVPVREPKALFAQVEKRFARAQALQSYDRDHAGDVEYLRATTFLHDGMKIVKTPADQARALYLLGKAYEILDELGAWNLHENYYEACVRRDPKSVIAKRCFNRLEASLYMGYSGSAGVNLPGDERARLEKLRALVN